MLSILWSKQAKRPSANLFSSNIKVVPIIERSKPSNLNRTTIIPEPVCIRIRGMVWHPKEGLISSWWHSFLNNQRQNDQRLWPRKRLVSSHVTQVLEFHLSRLRIQFGEGPKWHWWIATLKFTLFKGKKIKMFRIYLSRQSGAGFSLIVTIWHHALCQLKAWDLMVSCCHPIDDSTKFIIQRRKKTQCHCCCTGPSTLQPGDLCSWSH